MILVINIEVLKNVYEFCGSRWRHGSSNLSSDLSKFFKFGEFNSSLFLGSLKLKDPLTLGSSDAQKP